MVICLKWLAFECDYNGLVSRGRQSREATVRKNIVFDASGRGVISGARTLFVENSTACRTGLLNLASLA